LRVSLRATTEMPARMQPFERDAASSSDGLAAVDEKPHRQRRGVPTADGEAPNSVPFANSPTEEADALLAGGVVIDVSIGTS